MPVDSHKCLLEQVIGDVIVNQSVYGLEGVVGAAMCVSLLALGSDGLLGVLERALTPPGVGRAAHPLEPDVVTGVARV